MEVSVRISSSWSHHIQNQAQRWRNACACLPAWFFLAYRIQEPLLMNGAGYNALGFKLISFTLIMTITHRCVHKSIQWKSPLSETLFPDDFCLYHLQKLTITRTYKRWHADNKNNSNVFTESWRLLEWSKYMENFVYFYYIFDEKVDSCRDVWWRYNGK